MTYSGSHTAFLWQDWDLHPDLSGQESVSFLLRHREKDKQVCWAVHGRFNAVSALGLVVSVPGNITLLCKPASAGWRWMVASHAEEVVRGAGRTSTGSGRGKGRVSGRGSQALLGPLLVPLWVVLLGPQQAAVQGVSGACQQSREGGAEPLPSPFSLSPLLTFHFTLSLPLSLCFPRDAFFPFFPHSLPIFSY